MSPLVSQNSIFGLESIMSFYEIKKSFLRFIYKNILKRIFFLVDPEKIHDRMVFFGRWLGKYGVTRAIVSWFLNYSNPVLEQTILGIKFANPVGLAAGFDKNANLAQIVPSVGFGFAEVGSITGEPCEGNPKPRLWRLKKSESLVVNYGLKNDGSEAISKRLTNMNFQIPIGVNIAKTNNSETADAKAGIADYLKAYRLMSGVGDFHVINISCPNTYGGEPFSESNLLKALLSDLEKIRVAAPVLLKLSPDLSHEQIDLILNVAEHLGVNGYVCSNLLKKRNNPKIVDADAPDVGGISGRVAEDKANEQIRYIYRKTNKQAVIIGCGGIFSAEDAYRKIRLGASLVELITGMIFEGPQLIGEINFGLAHFLKKDGFNNISEVVGIDNRI